MKKTILFFFILILLVNTASAVENVTRPSASVNLIAEKTEVMLGEDIVLRLSAANILGKPVMTVQVYLIPPSGMTVISTEFASGVGQYISPAYKVEPGLERAIEVKLRANQVGDFEVKGRIIYYFGDDTSTTEDYTQTLLIKVREPATPVPTGVQETVSVQETPEGPSSGTLAIIGIVVLVLLIFGIKLLKRTPGAAEQPVQPRVSAPAKFQIGPTVRLRPVTDVIEAEQDGIVEFYMDNPSLNDVTLHVEARISVPSGFHIYGHDFVQASGAGTALGKFDVPSGTARTIAIVIKADRSARIGSHIIQFSGLYYPDENKDNYQQISLTYPLKVKETSKEPESPRPSNPERIPKGAETPATEM